MYFSVDPFPSDLPRYFHPTLGSCTTDSNTFKYFTKPYEECSGLTESGSADVTLNMEMEDPPMKRVKQDKFTLEQRNEQAIYDLFEFFESKGLRVSLIYAPAWLVRVMRGMQNFDQASGTNTLVGSIYGAPVHLVKGHATTIDVGVVPASTDKATD